MKIGKKIIATSVLFLFAFSAQSQTGGLEKTNSLMKNPLLQRSTLQYQAPHWDL